jgi:hypothetical protein
MFHILFFPLLCVLFIWPQVNAYKTHFLNFSLSWILYHVNGLHKNVKLGFYCIYLRGCRGWNMKHWQKEHSWVHSEEITWKVMI